MKIIACMHRLMRGLWASWTGGPAVQVVGYQHPVDDDGAYEKIIDTHDRLGGPLNQIVTDVDVYPDWRARLRILLGRPLLLEVRVATDQWDLHVLASRARVRTPWRGAHRWWSRRLPADLGGAEVVSDAAWGGAGHARAQGTGRGGQVP